MCVFGKHKNIKNLKNCCLLFLLLAVIAYAAGCSYVKVERIEEIVLPKKDKNFDVIVVEGDIERKNKPIAFLTVVGNIMTKKIHIEKKLQKEARKIGGDAVLYATYSFVSGRYPMATGVVVVYE